MNTAGTYTAKAETKINAPVSEVWKALTTPELIKQYLMGTEAVSEWKEGSALEFKGVWEGKEYHEKGKILKIEKDKILQHTYLMTGLEDVPDNYMIVTYKLAKEDSSTKLTLTQENVKTEEIKNHSEKNWSMVFQSLKQLLESKEKRSG